MIAEFIALPNNCFLLTADEFTDSHPFGDSTGVCIVILDTYEITWLYWDVKNVIILFMLKCRLHTVSTKICFHTVLEDKELYYDFSSFLFICFYDRFLYGFTVTHFSFDFIHSQITFPPLASFFLNQGTPATFLISFQSKDTIFHT